MSIGERAKEIRVDKGIKLKYVSEKLGFKSPSSYSGIESGDRRLDANKVPDLAKALDVEVEELFFDNNNRDSRIKEMEVTK